MIFSWLFNRVMSSFAILLFNLNGWFIAALSDCDIPKVQEFLYGDWEWFDANLSRIQ